MVFFVIKCTMPFYQGGSVSLNRKEARLCFERFLIDKKGRNYMKTKKSNRLLSVVLAILMVFAVCPMFALSAAEPTAEAETVTYWDGTVPGLTAGTTIPEFIMNGSTYTITKAQFDEHLNKWDGGITVKDETGLAMLSLITNCKTKITNADSSAWYDSTAAANPTLSAATNFLNYHTISIARDLYLNKPGQHTNQIAPLFWRTADTSGWTDIKVNGNGHAINGWYIDVTLSDDAFISIGFIGVLPNTSATIQKLALLDMEIKVTTVSPLNGTVNIGAIAGAVNKNRGGGTMSIQNCIVDSKVTFNSWLNSSNGWSSAPGHLWSSNPTGILIKGDIAGLVGQMQKIPNTTTNNGVQKVSFLNNTILFDYNINNTWSRVSGITCATPASAASFTLDNIIVAKCNNSGSKASEMGASTIHQYNAATTSTVTDLWTVGSIIPAFVIEGSNNRERVDTTLDTLWDANGATMDGMTKLAYPSYPVPTALATNDCVLTQLYYAPMHVKGTTVEIGTAQAFYCAFAATAYARAADTDGSYGNFNFKLTADIDMTGYNLPTATNIKSFDGQGHVVSNLTVNRVAKATETRMGGLTDILGNNDDWNFYQGTFQNVAFVNYNFNIDTNACTSQYFVGGLFGYVGTNSQISNVYLQGNLKVNGRSVGDNGGRLGTFGCALNYDTGSLGATFENCVFVGTASAPRAIAPFMEVFGYSNTDWAAIAKDSSTHTGKLEITNAAKQININNCYSLCYETDAEGNFTNWKGLIGSNVGMQALALTNAYQVGMKQNSVLSHEGEVNGYENVVDAQGNSLIHLGCFNAGDVANGNKIETAWGGPTAAYTLEQFQGAQAKNAMIFNNPAEWTYFEDGTPIPAVFGANASALSVKSIDGLAKTYNSTSMLGAQLRLDKAGIRFVAEYDTARFANETDYTIEYGILVLPTNAITAGYALDYTEALALPIATTDTAHLHAYGSDKANQNATGMKENYSALLGVLTGMPDAMLVSNMQFTVISYVAFLSAEDVEYNSTATADRKVSHIIYGDNSQSFSGLYLANVVCGDSTVSTAKKIAICERFASVEGFEYEVVGGQVVAKS